MFGNTLASSMQRNNFVLFIFFISEINTAYGYDCVKRPRVRYPFCRDRYEARKGHTMCLGTITQRHMNDTVRRELEDLHNTIRSGVSPPAANMIKLQGNMLLEKEAQLWAEQCKMSHDKADLRFLADRFTVGQNIAIGGPLLNWTDIMVNQWEQEKTSFIYGGSNNASSVKNYAQIIWADTFLFGCGVSKCGANHFYVCNYASSMDESRVDTPYNQSTTGKSCDSCTGNCDNVTSTLCDCKGKLCLNGGSLNLVSCTCSCITDVDSYHPEFCELNCHSHGDDPRCGSSPFERSNCRNNSETVFHCPWMCNICPYADKNYTESSELLPWEQGLPMCTTSTSSTMTSSSTVSLKISTPSMITRSSQSSSVAAGSTTLRQSLSLLIASSTVQSRTSNKGQHNATILISPNCHVINLLVILQLYLISAF